MSTVSPSMQRVKSRIDALGVSGATFATSCGLKPSMFSDLLRGIRSSGATEHKLATTSELLVELADAIAPLQIPNDPANLTRLLHHMQENGVTVEAVRSAIGSVFGDEANE